MLTIREGALDVAVVAGPRVKSWPSIGVKALSALCTEMGLKVGLIGGEDLRCQGVIPLPGAGGILLAEDVQKRIHRIRARAVVRVSHPLEVPDPFPGWRSEGVVPWATANKLLTDFRVTWEPSMAILGTGNRALRLGSQLLEEERSQEVYCIEAAEGWDEKPFAGWEVEHRRFTMLGGRVIHGKPLGLTKKTAHQWEFRIQDDQGVRMLTIPRLVSAGPFGDELGVKEYPAGSLLFELVQTSVEKRSEDVQGWILEEERGRWLGARLVRSLVHELGKKKDYVQSVQRKSRARMKDQNLHRKEPFALEHKGKWMARESSQTLKQFEGVPQHNHKVRMVASIECVEPIGCQLCERACPESAIQIDRHAQKFLVEADCTACGLCLPACPSGVPVMFEESEASVSPMVFSWRFEKTPKEGDQLCLVNRGGEIIGTTRVESVETPTEGPALPLVRVKVPSHLVWEARGLRFPKASRLGEEDYVFSVNTREEERETRIQVILNGNKRLVHRDRTLSTLFFESGMARPQDTLDCQDGSCGLCEVLVDGTPRKACSTQVRKGMNIKVDPVPEEESTHLCPCEGVSVEEVEKLMEGGIESTEALVSLSRIGRGQCHGLRCHPPFRRLLKERGSEWIDWRFPWRDFVL